MRETENTSVSLRPKTPLSLDDARKVTEKFVSHYNGVRLHSAIGYVTPRTKLDGREQEAFRIRMERLEAAKERRKKQRQRVD